MAFKSCDDPEEFPGQHLIVGLSVDEDYRQITLDPRQAAVWSTMDHVENFVDLAGPYAPPAPKEEDDWSFDFSDDDGNDVDNLDFSAFDGTGERDGAERGGEACSATPISLYTDGSRAASARSTASAAYARSSVAAAVRLRCCRRA